MAEQNKVQWVYSARNTQELEERYDQWAKDYDADLARDFDWQGPQYAASFFAKYVPKDARILDAGAGAGLVGIVLRKLGYCDIAAMDLSRGMLEEARRKNVYREFHQMVMGEPLDFTSDSFDAVISIGVLTLGHAPASSFDELIRITKPGGYIVFSLRPDVYENGGFKEKMTELENDGRWKLTEVSDKKRVLPKGEPDVYHQIWVYQVIG
ncbi:MAG: class I SAM-dependent methyltransferase [Chloroflexi bacterium]|nr:MAG: class I SAM-dependent methyltransferase [Chloroflexota bacterium]